MSVKAISDQLAGHDLAPEPMARPRLLPTVASSPLTPLEVYAVLSRVRPADAVIVNESTSTMAQQIEVAPDD
jgi:benzoylformate decarboxylase